MSVSLDPHQFLFFNRPLTQLVKRTLLLTNYNTQPVAFKVKTTAPKLYCVRPNSGRIEPNGQVEVQVLLQPMKEEPPLNAKCKDKFLVQSTIIMPEKEHVDLHDIWGIVEAEGMRIHQQKLKVAYLPPGATAEDYDEANKSGMTGIDDESRYRTFRGNPNASGFNASHMGQETTRPPLPTSIIPQPAPVQRTPSPPVEYTNAREATPDIVYPAPQHQQQQQYQRETPRPPVVHTMPEPAPQPQPQPHFQHQSQHQPAPPPAPRSDPALEKNFAELSAQYAEAIAEITRLRAALADQAAAADKLRRRSVKAMSDDGSATYTDGATDDGTFVDQGQFQPEGVPLPIVVGIALAVFGTTYLFF
ncbi:hypothetical protein BOTBODRAFT_455283 [Botryobasidium botryosum FD-172 SS1]|uniref:MSP domain-containing protein n=1 Tax=Botryobasidium botryosum (strain FD-172 SS1) TaxID=930990 RepID=A0A067M9R3_BOTB1|nr:hypothetical protein BOTBODRAFT_455283 [Botryobasidium botryosum FD-172 SS1]